MTFELEGFKDSGHRNKFLTTSVFICVSEYVWERKTDLEEDKSPIWRGLRSESNGPLGRDHPVRS